MPFGNLDNSPFKNLFTLNKARTARESSWQRDGGNMDWRSIAAGERTVLLELEGPGSISHIYWGMIANDPYDLRRAVLRMYWDGEETPSVEVPLGDFFGAANCIIAPYTSDLMAINLGMGPSFGFNCYFPMPFSDGARIELHNESGEGLGGALNALWYHIEYEQYDQPLDDDVGRFHAQWRRECLTKSAHKEETNVQLPLHLKNLSADDNYVALEAEGHGQMVGLMLHVDNVAGGWWGEGDDMVFVDGEPFPPRYHGTGTEEIFGGGASPTRPYFGPYTGVPLVQNPDHARNTTMYRWYVHDPIRFQQSLRWTLEHGHANTFENDYSSVAYWYQSKPSRPFPPLPPAKDRLPLPDPAFESARALFLRMASLLFDLTGKHEPRDLEKLRAACYPGGEALFVGRWQQALEDLLPVTELMKKMESEPGERENAGRDTPVS